MNDLKNFWLLLVLACFISCNQTLLAQKDKLTASVNATRIGLSDEMEITYTISSKTPEIYSFTRPDWKGFTLSSGPMQTKNESTNFVDGKGVTVVSLSLRYLLKPKNTGTFTIEPGKIMDKKGNEILSNAIRIEVLEKSPGISKPKSMNDLFGDNFGPLVGDMKKSKYEYVVSTGAVSIDTTLPETNGYNKVATPKKIQEIISGLTHYDDLGTYNMENLPRYYYTVIDTSGIRTKLNAYYAGDKKYRYITNIKPADKWNVYTEKADLGNKYRYYRYADYLCMLARQQHLKPDDQIKLYTMVLFSSADNRAKFLTGAIANNFFLRDSTTEKGYKDLTSTRYKMRIGKMIAPEKGKMDAMANDVFGLLEQYDGNLGFLAATDEK